MEFDLDAIPEHHRTILSAVIRHGRHGDYSGVYDALPDTPRQTVRTVAIQYGFGLGEPRKHPRPTTRELIERALEKSEGELFGEVGEALAASKAADPAPDDFMARTHRAEEDRRLADRVEAAADWGGPDPFTGGDPADRRPILKPSPERLYLGQDSIPAPVDPPPQEVVEFEADPGEPTDEELASFVYPGPEKDLPQADRPFFRAMAESTRLMIESVGSRSPAAGHFERYTPEARAACCAVIGLADIHLGKLAWARETGHNLDLAIGERIFRNGVVDLCDRISPMGIEEIVCPIGNDFYHYDNLLRTTTKGTWIDSDSRYPKVFHRGYEACCFAVDVMRSTGAKLLTIEHIPGNHDRLSSWHLVRELYLTYRNCPGVEIDMEPRTRKYHEYGRNLFGFDHGEKIVERELPGLMAFECRDILAGKVCLEWFLGHHHRAKRSVVLPEEDTQLGCSINWIPSLCGADSFLYEQAYIKGGRAARAYVYSKDHGREAVFEVRARES